MASPRRSPVPPAVLRLALVGGASLLLAGASPGAKLEWVTAPFQSTSYGSCHPVSVMAVQADGGPGANVAVNLTAYSLDAPGRVGLRSAACGPLDGGVVRTGSNGQASFSVLPLDGGDLYGLVDAWASGFPMYTPFNFQFGGGVANQLSYSSGVIEGPSGVCLTGGLVRTVDNSDGSRFPPSGAGSAVQLMLSEDFAALEVFSDPSCLDPLIPAIGFDGTVNYFIPLLGAHAYFSYRGNVPLERSAGQFMFSTFQPLLIEFRFDGWTPALDGGGPVDAGEPPDGGAADGGAKDAGVDAGVVVLLAEPLATSVPACDYIALKLWHEQGGEPVDAPEQVTVCAADGSPVFAYYASFAPAPVEGQRCFTGTLSQSGEAKFMSRLPALDVPLVVQGVKQRYELPATWTAPAPSPQRFGLRLAGGSSVTLAPGESAAVAIAPRSKCDGPVDLTGHALALEVHPALNRTELTPEADGGYTGTVMLRTCVGVGEGGAPVQVLLDGAPLLDWSGAPRSVTVHGDCALPAPLVGAAVLSNQSDAVFGAPVSFELRLSPIQAPAPDLRLRLESQGLRLEGDEDRDGILEQELDVSAPRSLVVSGWMDSAGPSASLTATVFDQLGRRASEPSVATVQATVGSVDLGCSAAPGGALGALALWALLWVGRRRTRPHR